jgi:hypothetical protein
MSLLSDFNEFLSNNELESNVTPQVLNEIEKYAKLADRREVIADMYKVAVERIFLDNKNLLPFAQDIFENVFDQYAGTNAKLNAVKDNVIRMASNDRSTNRSAESSESFINDIKEAILANDMPTGEKPMLEYFMENANQLVEEGVITLDDLIDVIDFALKNDVKVGQNNTPAMVLVNEWEKSNGREGEFAKHAISNGYKVDGVSAIKWAVKDDIVIDGKPAFLYAVEDLGKNQDKIFEWAVKNDINIGGEPAIKLAVKNDIVIDGKPAFLYAAEDLGKNEEKILKYAIKNDVNIDGKPALEWAFLNDKAIAGKPPMEYATSINVSVGGMDLMDWVDKNADRLLTEKASKETVVGKHTAKYERDIAASQTTGVKVR